MSPSLILWFLASAAVVQTADARQGATTAANPIRKVVNMLQMMQKKVEAEGEKEEEMFEKFMCYCKNGRGDLEKSIAASDAAVPELQSNIEEAEAQMKQLGGADLPQHKKDRDAAKKTIQEATALREKEATEFAATKSESDSNIAAINKAVAALEKGAGGAFLQTSAASVVRHLVQSMDDMNEADRQDVMSFLAATQGSEYAPQSGEITGILKQIGDEMSKSLADATAAEDASIKSFDELMSAKKKEIEALTAAIEEKMERVGELGVNIANMKNDLSDTEEALIADKKFLADLDKNCAKKQAEWDEIKKTRAEELVALADTIKILNDDDALELFKKTLPGAASFVQLKVTGAARRARALGVIRAAKRSNKLDFIALALHGKAVGFEKIIKMIDEMVVLLKTEQGDDNKKKEYCDAEFDATDDKKKGLERSISDSEAAIEAANEGIAALVDEIKALAAGVKALDKSVAEATEQRQNENADFKELMAQDSAAKELLGFAKNRLNKFYNKALYKPPPARVLSEEDQIVSNMGGDVGTTPAPGGIAGTGVTVFAQVRAHSEEKDAPAPPPETPGPFKKKTEESGGVIAMIDLLVKDLDKEMTVAKTEEKDAQEDYEHMMKESADKRAADTRSSNEKTAAKADMEAQLQQHTDDKDSASKELSLTNEAIHALHGECDWLLQYFDARKEARTGEIDALSNAKAVLSGADYSLLQTTRTRSLRGRA